MLSEIKPDRYCMVSLICGIKNERKQVKLTEKESRMVGEIGRG